MGNDAIKIDEYFVHDNYWSLRENGTRANKNDFKTRKKPEHVMYVRFSLNAAVLYTHTHTRSVGALNVMF